MKTISTTVYAARIESAKDKIAFICFAIGLGFKPEMTDSILGQFAAAVMFLEENNQ